MRGFLDLHFYRCTYEETLQHVVCGVARTFPEGSKNSGGLGTEVLQWSLRSNGGLGAKSPEADDFMVTMGSFAGHI